MIYFLHIQSGERAGTTKVGTSKTPARRSVDIADDLQCDVVLHAVMDGGLAEESAAHAALADHRVPFGSHREFFRRGAAIEYAARHGARVVSIPFRRGRASRSAMRRIEVAPRASEERSARVALDQWCAADRGRAARLALILDVQESTVSRWRAGTSTPGGPARLALPQVTGGAVPLDGWDAPSADEEPESA